MVVHEKIINDSCLQAVPRFEIRPFQFVMAGLDPAIHENAGAAGRSRRVCVHISPGRSEPDRVDGRVKPGHDGVGFEGV
jgi:hypothetical protein